MQYQSQMAVEVTSSSLHT